MKNLTKPFIYEAFLHSKWFLVKKVAKLTFTIEEENLICIYHKYDRRRTIAAISDALPDMGADMRPLAEQTIHKLHNMTDAAFEEAQFTMTLSDAE